MSACERRDIRTTKNEMKFSFTVGFSLVHKLNFSGLVRKFPLTFCHVSKKCEVGIQRSHEIFLRYFTIAHEKFAILQCQMNSQSEHRNFGGSVRDAIDIRVIILGGFRDNHQINLTFQKTAAPGG